MPVIESICIHVSSELTCAETAIITRMASYPDADNCTAEKMHSMFLGSSYDEIKATLEGLNKSGYLNKNADVYIYYINKLISLCSPEPIKVAAPPSSIPSISSSCLMPIMSIDI